MRVACILSNGFEEIEAVTPVDVLRRAGLSCDYYSIDGIEVEGAHGIVLKADYLLTDAEQLLNIDMIILPGGMPGAQHLAQNTIVQQLVREFDAQGKYIAAICAAPALVLGNSGIVAGRKVTCYPGMEHHFSDAIYCSDLVVVDKNIITSQGPGTAMMFAFELVKLLKGESTDIEYGMLWNKIIPEE